MYRVIFLALVAGCASGPPASGFRNAGTQIYSNAVLESDRLVGDWVQVAEFASPRAEPCKLGGAKIARGAQGLILDARLCLNGAQTTFSGPLTASGPGRFAPPKGEVWWVLWADVGYRTLAIGTPSGQFGFILNRGGYLPADRLRAAREVLEWNGYALAQLR